MSTVLEENPTLRTDQVGPTHGISAFAANVTNGVSNLSIDGKELHQEVDRSHWMHFVLHVGRYGLNISRAKDDVGRRLRRGREAQLAITNQNPPPGTRIKRVRTKESRRY